LAIIPEVTIENSNQQTGPEMVSTTDSEKNIDFANAIELSIDAVVDIGEELIVKDCDLLAGIDEVIETDLETDKS
jgi:hypothetical protein